MYVYHILLMRSLSVDRHVGYLHRLAIVSNAATTMDIQTSLLDPAFNSFGSIPRNGIVGSCGNSNFNFIRNFHTVFHSGYTILQSPQQGTRVLIFPHLVNTCYFLDFFFFS